ALYVLAFLDRSNIGFAKETYQLDTGLSNEAYALGAGIFFVVYAFLGVPANLLMRKFGARRWIGCTTLLWGVLSAAMAWADTEAKFLLVRTLLGAAEAGFFPGMIYLTSQWFPQQNRASIMGLFYMGAPLALTLGSPLSGALLGTKVGFVASVVTAIPWMAALFGTWLIPRYSDRTGERRNIAALTLLAAAVGIAVSGLVAPVLAIIALCVAAVGVIAVQPVFWTMPTQLLSGTALAAGIGFVNLFGAIGGFLAPIVRVQAETLFASSAAGLLTLAGVAIVGVVIIFSLSLTRAVPQRGSVQH
ncbi:MFS transporter, partial [Klebsiella pneumoniae]